MALSAEPAARTKLIGPADPVTALRLPLAVAFPLVEDGLWRLAFVAVAALSDLADGIVARRLGPSRIGVVLDPIADKAFMVSAFLTLAGARVAHALSVPEIALLLLRDFAAIAAFVLLAARGRATVLPARMPGKLVTTGQFLTLGAILASLPFVRPLAWATIAVGLYAVYDYGREALRVDREDRQAATPGG